MPDTIGFIGLGNMGQPMAHRLLSAGYVLHVFDLNKDALAAAAKAGAIPCGSASECAEAADVLLTSLPRPDHVAAVMCDAEVLQALASGSVWVDMTTNDKQLLKDLAAAAPDGVAIVDAPVTGAVDGARNGKLTLFAGGLDSDLDRVEPVLAQLGRVIRCGPLGSGNITKLVTNQLWFVHAAAIGEAFALGSANGVGLDVLWESIKDSVGDSFVARHDAPSIFAGHYDPSFTLDLCLKDLGLIEGLSEAVGADLPVTNSARAAFQLAAERYGQDAAELHVAKRIEDDADLSFRLCGDWVPPWEA